MYGTDFERRESAEFVDKAKFERKNERKKGRYRVEER